eukprot:1152168-Pelagomonas_calceolata.AAC.11
MHHPQPTLDTHTHCKWAHLRWFCPYARALGEHTLALVSPSQECTRWGHTCCPFLFTLTCQVGTLAVAGLKEAMANLRRLLAAADKHSYTMLVGRPNPTKLANFPERGSTPPLPALRSVCSAVAVDSKQLPVKPPRIRAGQQALLGPHPHTL